MSEGLLTPHWKARIFSTREKSQGAGERCEHGGNVVRFLSSVRHCGAMAGGRPRRGQKRGCGRPESRINEGLSYGEVRDRSGRCLGLPSLRGRMAVDGERSRLGMRRQFWPRRSIGPLGGALHQVLGQIVNREDSVAGGSQNLECVRAGRSGSVDRKWNVGLRGAASGEPGAGV